MRAATRRRSISAAQPGCTASARHPSFREDGVHDHAAKVSISHQAATLTDIERLAHEENAASATSSVADIDKATELIKQLSAQIRQTPDAAAAHVHVNPRAVLNLLS